MRLKKGDMVKVIAGKFKGQTGKVIAVNSRNTNVTIEGINTVKRAQKPSMITPQGGIVTLHKPLDASKVALVHPTKKTATSRIGYSFKKDGAKVRVYIQASKKEIDS
jgi:large subunit ribosomal protein L24